MQFKRRAFGPQKEVSLFTLGTMRAIASLEQMYLVVKEAYLTGINHIETAPSYGPAEVLLGKSIKKLDQEGLCPKEKWIITSKILPGKTFNEGKKQIMDMIRDIGIKRIDNLAIHGLNLAEHLLWAKEEDGAKLFLWAQKEGLVNQVGFSSHGSKSLIKEAIETNKFDFCSLHVHLLNQTNLPLAKLALNKGMGVMAISPADKGGHLHSPTKQFIEDCRPIEPLELAYRFLLAQGLSSLTVGASKVTDFHTPKKLINSIGPLTEIEESCIRRLFKKSHLRLGETFCGQCRECLPCPNGVPIPEILNLRNIYIGHGLKSFANERYNLIGRADHWWEKTNASSCKECGDCLPRCPHNLNIPDLLKQTHVQLLDSPTRRLWG